MSASHASFLNSIDTIIWGRKTFDQSCDFVRTKHQGVTEFPFIQTEDGKKIKNYVLTGKRDVKNRNEDVLEGVEVEVVCPDDFAEWVNKLVRMDGRDIWLMGGAETIQRCTEHQLITDYIITIHPTLLGSGIPLFHSTSPVFTSLKLVRHHVWNNGMVQLHYSVQ